MRLIAPSEHCQRSARSETTLPRHPRFLAIARKIGIAQIITHGREDQRAAGKAIATSSSQVGKEVHGHIQLTVSRSTLLRQAAKPKVESGDGNETRCSVVRARFAVGLRFKIR
jgi:hypothetical protein